MGMRHMQTDWSGVNESELGAVMASREGRDRKGTLMKSP